MNPIHYWRTVATACTSLLAGVSVAAPVQDHHAAAEGHPLALQSTDGHERGLHTAIESVYPALVRIWVVMEMPGNGRIERRRGAGSGVIVHPDGYIVTNHHVAGNAAHIVCNLADHQEIEAVLVGTDPLADIAVLKINLSDLRDPDAALPVARWGDSEALQVGDTVFAMGSPAAISQSVTRGIIANTKMIMPGNGGMQKLDGEDVGTIVRWLVHDATIFGGNSGGPLVNEHGEIVGINEIGFANLSGAIPGNLARRAADEIIEHGEVRRSWTGITMQERLDSQADQSGALVASVATGSPAEQAGIRAGDLLQQYGDRPIDCAVAEDVPVAQERLMAAPVGHALEVLLARDGKPVRTTLITVQRERAQPRPIELRAWGIVYSDISRSMLINHDLESRGGAFVLSVRPGSPAVEANPPLKAGDIVRVINGEPIQTAADLTRIAKSHTTDDDQRHVLLAEVSRDGASLVAVIEIGPEKKQRPAARAKKPWLPIETQVLTREIAGAIGLGDTKGVRVTKIIDTPGHDAPPLEVADVITAVGGRPVKAYRANDTRVFRNMIERLAVGDEVRLDVIRGGEARVVHVSLIEPHPGPEAMERYENEFLELECRNLTLSDRRHPRASDGGAHVEEVTSGGWASLGEIRTGDIILALNGTPVENVSDLKMLLTESVARQHPQIVLFVLRGTETHFLVLEPTWNAP